MVEAPISENGLADDMRTAFETTIAPLKEDSLIILGEEPDKGILGVWIFQSIQYD